MTLRIENELPQGGVALLRHTYLFVTERWQHMKREPIPDQGFEERFRESCLQPGWVISQHRELNLGSVLTTSSGVLHEIDLVAQNEPLRCIFELKNRQDFPPEKNDVIVFFAKILDYLCVNPSLLKQTLVPVFMSAFAFEYTGLAACIGLGIHPVAPGLRPLPLLVHNARCMGAERDKGLALPEGEWDAYEDFCVELNRLSALLSPADLNRRCDSLNEETITIRATKMSQTVEIGDQLRAVNAECSRLIEVVKTATVRRTS
ncbi:hypothetical protein EP7_004378 [Isosphaeraceae bacterium EP7]